MISAPKNEGEGQDALCFHKKLKNNSPEIPEVLDLSSSVKVRTYAEMPKSADLYIPSDGSSISNSLDMKVENSNPARDPSIPTNYGVKNSNLSIDVSKVNFHLVSISPTLELTQSVRTVFTKQDQAVLGAVPAQSAESERSWRSHDVVAKRPSSGRSPDDVWAEPTSWGLCPHDVRALLGSSELCPDDAVASRPSSGSGASIFSMPVIYPPNIQNLQSTSTPSHKKHISYPWKCTRSTINADYMSMKFCTHYEDRVILSEQELLENDRDSLLSLLKNPDVFFEDETGDKLQLVSGIFLKLKIYNINV
jgi:hypothetical protein